MGKLLLLVACVLGTAVAGRIPIDDRMSWRNVLQQQPSARPTLMDLINLRWQMMPRPGLQLENRDRDRDEAIESELEQRYNRVPLSRDIVERNVEQTLPTTDVNSDRLLHVGRRRQQQQMEQQPMMPRRVMRIGEGRRVDAMPEQDILQLMRRDNRLSELSDQEIVEMLRRQRQQRMDDDDNLQTLRRDDERLVHINRRRMQQGNDEMSPLRVGRIGEGRRVEQREEGRRGMQQREEQREEGRRDMRMMEQRREQDIEEPRMREERGEAVGNSLDSLESVRRDDERLVHINRRRLEQSQDETMMPRRMGRINDGRRVGDVNAMTEQDILQFIRRDNRLTNLSDGEIIEMLRRNRQRKTDIRQQEQRVEDREQGEDIDRLQSLRRDDERLVHVNRRRLEQTQDEMMMPRRMDEQSEDEMMMPRRIGRIGEGRRVGDVNAMSEQDILQFIRRDNRLSGASDEQIIEMLRRQRERRLENVQDDDDNSLESMRRDDERLVHINRRRLGQTV
ncbi:hypothetical protein KR044_001748 [Drosophila immigrans]|nr:hypothetical protein KR044_001748 [Drosophila immigrans]